MKNVTKNFKTFICIVFAVLVAGMAVLGFLGLNQTVDFSKSYEIMVGVDQNVGNASELVKENAEAYFADKGVLDKAYGYQSLDGGNVHLYKFDVDTGIEQEKLMSFLQTKINNDKIFVEVSVNEVVRGNTMQTLNVVLALAIGAVAVFVYLCVMEKLASALSVLATSILATLLFVAVVACSRIPALPFFEICAVATLVLSLIFSTVIANRFKEEKKKSANESLSVREIANIAISSSARRLTFLFIAILLIAILFACVGRGYSIFLGLQLLVADVCSVFVAVFATPTLWTALKTEKKVYKK